MLSIHLPAEGFGGVKLFLDPAVALAALKGLEAELGCIKGGCHRYADTDAQYRSNAALAVAFQAALLGVPDEYRKARGHLVTAAYQLSLARGAVPGGPNGEPRHREIH